MTTGSGENKAIIGDGRYAAFDTTKKRRIAEVTFIPDKANVIFLGGVGVGKTHLASALGYQACLEAHSVLFATAIDVINTLAAA